MCEQRVRTRVRTAAGWRGLQEFLIADRGEPAVEEVEVEGIAEAAPTPEVLAAIERADAIVIGPSNPVISIGPILAIPGLREAIAAAPAPVVAVSPYVAGRGRQGADRRLHARARPAVERRRASPRCTRACWTASSATRATPSRRPTGSSRCVCPTLMEGSGGRRSLAVRTLEFAASLR